MATRLDDLPQRRRLLLARSAQQRADIIAGSEALGRPLEKVEHGVQFVKNLRRHPSWIICLLIGVALIKPRRFLVAIDAARVASRTFSMVEPIVNRLRR